MGRKKNVISTVVFDAADIDAIEKVIAENQVIQQRLLREFRPAVLRQTRDNVNTRIVQPMLRMLGVYPGRQLGMKMRWKSEKQRRYVMMLLTKQAEERLGRKLRPGDSIAYKRTFTLRDSWQAEVLLDEKKGVIRLRVWNDAKNEQGEPYHRFVTGDIGLGESRRSMERYKKPMQPFHQDRGWQPSFPIIQRYTEDMKDEAAERYEATLSRLITRRP